LAVVDQEVGDCLPVDGEHAAALDADSGLAERLAHHRQRVWSAAEVNGQIERLHPRPWSRITPTR
jgi:hypothetical protein